MNDNAPPLGHRRMPTPNERSDASNQHPQG